MITIPRCMLAALLALAAVMGLARCSSHPGVASAPAGAANSESASPSIRSSIASTPAPAPGRAAAGDELTWTALDPTDELWVIARAQRDVATPEPPSDIPGTGAMLGRLPAQPEAGEPEELPLPLAHTDVRAAITGFVASVELTQQFRNPYDGKIEAVYVFPLPQNAAVNGFVMKIGERRIRGIIREREEAERVYQQARAAGHTASLLTQQRPNIFTQSVANIEPGKAIDVTITYFHTLSYVDGWYQWVFPMVVGPRFNPPGTTDGIGTIAHESSRGSGQPTDVAYLPPTQRSGHDIALTVDLDTGVSIEEIACSSHVVDVAESTPGRRTVTLSPRDNVPNKDFVLRYRVAGAEPKASMLAHRDERGGFFTLMLYPPAGIESLGRAPLELIFVVDCSGSMSGEPLAKARRAMERALRRLDPSDTFQVVRFSNDTSQLGPAPLPATDKNIRKAVRYVKRLDSGGGTHMMKGLRAALDFPHTPGRDRYVALLTDGYIGNDREILGALNESLNGAKVFSFGIGSSPNRYLLERMAKVGRGAVAYAGLNDDAGAIMDLFMDRIRHPALSDIAIDWGTLRVRDVFPERIADLYVGRPVILTGRFDGAEPTTIRVRGRLGEEIVAAPVAVNPGAETAAGPALASVWARMRIADLADRATWAGAEETAPAIRELALEFGLVSEYTAFVAVDSRTVTEGEHGTTVHVGVPVPDGVRYDTTVGSEGGDAIGDDADHRVNAGETGLRQEH